MSQTTKNWITTLIGAFLTGFCTYLMSSAPSDPSSLSWALWKPLLTAALFAGITGAWHAYQPKSGKANDSTPPSGNTVSSIQPKPAANDTIPPKTVARISGWIPAATIGVMLTPLIVTPGAFVQREVAPAAVGCQNGQLNPQVVTVSTNVLALLGCGLVTYSRDTSTAPINWTTVALDLAASCGMDVADIVAAFGASSPVAVAAQSNTMTVHMAAIAFKTKVVTPIVVAPAASGH